MNWWLIVGASLHWGSLFFQGVDISAGFFDGAACVYAVAPIAAIIATMVAVAPCLLRERLGRTVFSLLGVAGGVVSLVAPYCTGISMDVLSAVSTMGLSVNVSSLVILWGFAFASLDKRAAGRNMVGTALFAVFEALAMVVCVWSTPVPADLLGVLMRAVSACSIIMGKVIFEDASRPLRPAAHGSMARFFAMRLFLGFSIGLLWGRPLVDGPSIATAAACCACALGCCALFASACRRDVYEYVHMMPLVVVGVYTLPFCANGGGVPAGLGASSIWICWIIVSSFQISGLKEVFGMGEIRLGAAEKAVLLAGWSTGLLVGGISDALIAGGVVPAAFVLVAMAWAVGSGVRTVYNRQEDEFIKRMQAERLEKASNAVAALAQRYGLTQRESQVALLMAQGYSRPYICEELSISDGTMRAHSSHIYAKLSIHRRDELLALVRQQEDERA